MNEVSGGHTTQSAGSSSSSRASSRASNISLASVASGLHGRGESPYYEEPMIKDMPPPPPVPMVRRSSVQHGASREAAEADAQRAARILLRGNLLTV